MSAASSKEQHFQDVLLDGILDNLEHIGYEGPLLVDGALEECIDKSLSSPLFIELCVTLCSSLKQLDSVKSALTTPQGPEDVESFQLELKSILRELSCPHTCLMEDVAMLDSCRKRLLLIDYLLSELMASRILQARSKVEPMETGEERSIPAALEAILRTYEIKKPPANITVQMLFDKIIGTTKDMVAKAPDGYISPSLVTQPLSSEQLETLDSINTSLSQEYEVRRNMLLTRCDVTVQSFRWSDKIKGKEDEFSEVYQTRRQLLQSCAPVAISRVLAAKKDILTVEKTNSSEVRANTQCSINKVLIGKVPDRGGRPSSKPPPPEMPAFKARSADDQRKGGGRGRGSRVQGSWSGGKKGGAKGGGWQQDGGRHFQKGGGGKQKQYYS